VLIATPPPKALFIKLNILIDQDGHARLADFGLLTIVLDSTHHTSSTTPKSAGTTRWMSPELLDPDRFGRENGRPTKDSDCYALGMVILEVLSGKPPFPNYNGTSLS
jgi:serine/threonine protein kinase